MAHKIGITLPDGREYPSLKECAADLNLTVAAVSKARSRGRLHRLGKGKTEPRRGRKLEFEGKTYPSIAAASRETGVPESRIARLVFGESASARPLLRWSPIASAPKNAHVLLALPGGRYTVGRRSAQKSLWLDAATMLFLTGQDNAPVAWHPLNSPDEGDME